MMRGGADVPDMIRVTHPDLDAPDGAVLTFPNGNVYERIGDEWCRLGDVTEVQP